jgi:hypothetical protein
MRLPILAASAVLTSLWLGPVARAQTAGVTPATIRSCILAAANVYREPPAVLLILLNLEGGTLGAVSENTNATVDIGPMQVNQTWIPAVATHWHASQQATFFALRDNFCANVEAGAWILRQGLDEADGDLWGGVAFYHSHTPEYQRQYLLAVLKQALRLEKSAHTPRRSTGRVAVANPQASDQAGG